MSLSSEEMDLLGDVAGLVDDSNKTSSGSSSMALDNNEPSLKEKKLVYKDMNAQGMKSIFDREEYSDFRIVLKQTGRTLHVYKGILAARSEFFKALVEAGFSEKDNNQLEVDDESEEKALVPLLEFCYTGEITVPESEVLAYYFIADKYQVVSLRSKCADFLVGGLRSENALENFIEYYSKFERNGGIADDLTEKMIKRSVLFILKTFSGLCKNLEKRKILLSMDYEMLMRWLRPSAEGKEFKGINCEPSTFLRFVLEWTTQDIATRSQYLAELVSLEKKLEYGSVLMLSDDGGELLSIYGEPEFIYEKSATEVVGSKITKKTSNYSSIYVNTMLGNAGSTAIIRWKVKIITLNSWIGMGVAMKEVVEKKKLTFSPYDKHGTYMLSHNGYIWNQFMKGSTKYESVGCSYGVGDTVIIELLCAKKELNFYKNDTTNKLATFTNVKLPVYPSFMLCGTESVEFAWDLEESEI
ncbi:hypothetical protein FDP41_012595 [Naegleria fowleri]|uniref:BTB domain-containing protein n=1 Tax=Naegleria fowleri TaxID=5763 RepID=A0A6A5C761_NAEFO|nr:uncharacterized protein FDP41_012595 [Naegleria fowleri]KAF0981335.1 hypothetical protein FDP41_012595 [Naegleria fowleri]